MPAFDQYSLRREHHINSGRWTVWGVLVEHTRQYSTQRGKDAESGQSISLRGYGALCGPQIILCWPFCNSSTLLLRTYLDGILKLHFNFQFFSFLQWTEGIVRIRKSPGDLREIYFIKSFYFWHARSDCYCSRINRKYWKLKIFELMV